MTPEQVDARGLSCPEPVLLSKRAIERLEGGILEVLVDTETSRENVMRLARSLFCSVEAQERDDGACVLRIRRG